jgi:hypothetical protein
MHRFLRLRHDGLKMLIRQMRIRATRSLDGFGMRVVCLRGIRSTCHLIYDHVSLSPGDTRSFISNKLYRKHHQTPHRHDRVTSNSSITITVPTIRSCPPMPLLTRAQKRQRGGDDEAPPPAPTSTKRQRQETTTRRDAAEDNTGRCSSRRRGSGGDVRTCDHNGRSLG